MYPQFDRNRLIVRPLRERQHELTSDHQLALDAKPAALDHASLKALLALGGSLLAAQARGKTRLLLLDEPALRAGIARHVVDMLERGWFTHVVLNSEAALLDYEWALLAAAGDATAPSSSVVSLWRELGELNDIVRTGAANDQGLGEALGLAMNQSFFPHKELSILSAGIRLGIPVMVQLAIGCDRLQEHPNFDPASFAIASYRDFLTLTRAVDQLEQGVVVSVGALAMLDIMLSKAIAMARNVSQQEGRAIERYTVGVLRSSPVEMPLPSSEQLTIIGESRHTVPLLRQATLHAASRQASPPG